MVARRALFPFLLAALFHASPALGQDGQGLNTVELAQEVPPFIGEGDVLFLLPAAAVGVARGGAIVIGHLDPGGRL